MYLSHDLTDAFPMKFDVQKMRSELKMLKKQKWLGHYDRTIDRGWNMIPLVSLDGKAVDEESLRNADYSRMKRTEIVNSLPYFQQILDSFKCPQGRIRISKLDPGSRIAAHRDIGHEVANIAFNKVRLHIPIYTNDNLRFIVGGKTIKMEPGRLYYVNFSKVHYVVNDGEKPRIHLILDLEVNEWLRQYFPKHNLLNKIETLTSRMTLPIFWKLRRTNYVVSGCFWKAYNGSLVQRLKKTMFS